MLYELINPSDPYTFHAPSIEVAGSVAVLLSSGFGAKPARWDGETTPILFGWDAWLKDRGIDKEWLEAHCVEIADAYDSFLIGNANDRADVESMLADLPPERREKWRAERQDRLRTSMNRIGERAYQLAKRFRDKASSRKSEPERDGHDSEPGEPVPPSQTA